MEQHDITDARLTDGRYDHPCELRCRPVRCRHYWAKLVFFVASERAEQPRSVCILSHMLESVRTASCGLQKDMARWMRQCTVQLPKGAAERGSSLMHWLESCAEKFKV